jgi:hypothetical protein
VYLLLGWCRIIFNEFQASFEIFNILSKKIGFNFYEKEIKVKGLNEIFNLDIINTKNLNYSSLLKIMEFAHLKL